MVGLSLSARFEAQPNDRGLPAPVSGLAPPRGRTRLFFDLAILAACLTATGQEKPGSELFRTITELDEAPFDADNERDVDALRNDICGKVRRELVPGRLSRRVDTMETAGE
jgi:hypothetical protein